MGSFANRSLLDWLRRRPNARQERVQPASRRCVVWREFCEDAELRDTYGISEEEMESLREIVLLGDVHSERDLLFILNTIRASQRR